MEHFFQFLTSSSEFWRLFFWIAVSSLTFKFAGLKFSTFYFWVGSSIAVLFLAFGLGWIASSKLGFSPLWVFLSGLIPIVVFVAMAFRARSNIPSQISPVAQPAPLVAIITTQQKSEVTQVKNTPHSVWPKPESVAGYNDLLLKQSKANIKAMKWVSAVMFTGSIALWFWAGRPGDNVLMPACVIAAFWATFLGAVNNNGVSQWEYQQIPHAMLNPTTQQCIWCGNRGIYTHGQYKSNAMYNRCSKCKTVLYN